MPNNIIAKAKLINASIPATGHGITIVVRLESTVTPSRGCRVLEMALLSCNRILREPEPSVTVRSLDAVGLECELQFFVTAIEQGPAAQNELFDLVYRHCASAGIRQALPPQSASVLPPRSVRRDPSEAPRWLLDHLPIFALLTDDERAALAPKLKRRAFKAGDVLIEHGTVAQALSILSSGALVASQDNGDGTDDGEVVRLGPCDCFGEAGVLTGALSVFRVSALTRAVIVEIAKDDLAPLLKQRPAIAAEIGQILARREEAGRARVKQDADRDRPGENLAERMAERMRDLFRLA